MSESMIGKRTRKFVITENERRDRAAMNVEGRNAPFRDRHINTVKCDVNNNNKKEQKTSQKNPLSCRPNTGHLHCHSQRQVNKQRNVEPSLVNTERAQTIEEKHVFAPR